MAGFFFGNSFANLLLERIKSFECAEAFGELVIEFGKRERERLALCVKNRILGLLGAALAQGLESLLKLFFRCGRRSFQREFCADGFPIFREVHFGIDCYAN